MTEIFNQFPDDQLTEKELEILILMASGLTNREIGERLFLALETIRWYSKRIYSKLQVRNRMEATTLARQLGLIQEKSQSSSVLPMLGLPQHNLPAQVTAFLGRTKELKELTYLITKEENRLVTILAPGGMGKTRLAIQVAKSTLANFTDGVLFIALENFDSPDQIVAAIVEHLNIQLTSSQKTDEQLFTYLSNKKIFLVLDGYEKLLPENKLITNLLARVSGLTLLITSRKRINLQGETIYKIKGLELPQGEDSEKLIKSSPVQLFIQSAKLARPNFDINNKDLSHLLRICQLVEGMPLGILLAAAWIEVLSPGEIANEIAKNLDFLKTEKSDVPERQKSVRAVFDYSINMLREVEIPVFIRLSVFRGGFTREAAEAVAGAKLEQLALFVGKSLLQYDPIEKRYRFHELLRQYSHQRLDQIGLLGETLERFIDFYIGFVSQIEKDIKGPDQFGALDRIRADLDNIRFAWNWSIKQNNIDFIDHSLECIYWFCSLRGRVQEGEELFQKARNQFVGDFETGTATSQHRLLLRFDASGDDYRIQLEGASKHSRKDNNKLELAFLLWAHGVNGYVMQDFPRAIKSLEESLALYQELQDQFYMVEVIHLLWICHKFLGHTEKANMFFHQSLDLGREAGNKIAVARALGSGGAFEFLAGNYPDAETYTQEALIVRREVEDKAGEAMSLAMLGWLASIRGELEQAKLFAQTSLKIATKVHNLNSKMTSINVLGWIACLKGDFLKAKRLCQENHLDAPDPTVAISAKLVLSFATCGLEDYQTSKEYLKDVLSFGVSFDGHGLVLMCLPIIALILAHEGEAQKAVEHLAFAFTFPSAKFGWLGKCDYFSELQNNLELELGEKEFQSAWERGKSLGVEEIVQYSLEFLNDEIYSSRS